MAGDTLIAAGFSDPVFQSQNAFRALLAALSEPGARQEIARETPAPDGLDGAAATVLLTLADYETPIWLAPALRIGAAGAWLRFHCGAALVDDPASASFAVIDGSAHGPLLAEFNPGHDQFPDRSTTVIVSCVAFEGGAGVTLSGPGIAGTRSLAPRGLRPGFWAEVAANADRYPLGVDLILSCGEALIGLPRTTRIAETV
ncbi:MAG: phosphonate C-P lyase system protein PhnH [Beijerinckiaceae bacterium]|nr:phosphonate C-P lyase system protein PhnH [Beijerinckiaceae bacterium]